MTLENVVIFLVVGLIAGFLASLVVMGKGRGWFWNIVIGILGAIIGGWLAGVLRVSLPLPDFVNRVVIAFAGAVILLLVWRVLFGRKRK